MSSSALLTVVSGTGTGIGKTHVSTALLLAWARARPDGLVVGLKPVESGVEGAAGADGETLEQASTFHVKRFRPPYLLKRAVSPHLAAREEGVTVELGPIVDYVHAAGAGAERVLVELAGGLFSPLSTSLTNADVVVALRPAHHVLVAPDRLGVLHDVAAAVRAAAALSPHAVPTAIVLVAPEAADASTGTNAQELCAVTAIPVVAELPREAPTASAARLGSLA